MTHREIIELLPWYVNGTLAERERDAVRSEIASCAECAEEVEWMNAVESGLRQLGDATVPSLETHDRVFSRLAVHRASGLRSAVDWFLALRPWIRFGALAMPAVLVALIFFTQFRQGGGVDGVVAPLGNVQSEDMSKAAAPAPPFSVAAPRQATSGIAGAAGKVAAPGVARPQPAALIRKGELDLIVPNVDDAIGEVTRIAHATGGDVRSLQDNAPDAGSARSATIQISVPHDRFETTLNQLGAIGRVRSRSIGAEDVSDQIVDSQARLRNLRHEEADLVRIMDRSGKMEDVLSVEQELSSVRQQIEQLDAELRSTQSRVAYSSIAVTMTAEQASSVVEIGPLAELGNSWKNATHAAAGLLRSIAALALWLVAFSPYFILLGVIAYVVRRRVRGS
ncbi:MAG TPA: DUF4349 domain-containing protein [Candidatus Baltobacteraceae bacterium]|nr:DUF4349 domain-containing protein [Candidatus Baltobacteraceae bacterium]